MGKAVISECGTYRYQLEREWNKAWKKRALFIMLNPSTADAEKDDPTIRRCINFANREGCTQLSVVNLFAYRSTDPKWLWGAPDPVGPENDAHIHHEILGADLVIAAWGANGLAGAAFPRVLRVQEYAGSKPVLCLGMTKEGAPRHPLYIARDQPLESFKWKTQHVEKDTQ